jgi:hypothetical protein
VKKKTERMEVMVRAMHAGKIAFHDAAKSMKLFSEAMSALGSFPPKRKEHPLEIAVRKATEKED